MERHMTDEALTSRLLDAISEITRLGGEEERTSIVPGILVVDAAPNDLPSGYIKIVNPRDGTYVPCLLVSGLVVADNDFVNVLFTKGTEPIALSQSPGSPSSGVKVSEVWESDFGAVAGSADASGNWTWQNNVTLASGDLAFGAATPEISSAGSITLAPAVGSPVIVAGGSGNTRGLRLLGSSGEIADMFVSASGTLILDLANSTDSEPYVEIRPTDDEYGLKVTAPGVATPFLNIFVVDDTVDYANLTVSAVGGTDGLFIQDGGNVGFNTSSPFDLIHAVNGNAEFFTISSLSTQSSIANAIDEVTGRSVRWIGMTQAASPSSTNVIADFKVDIVDATPNSLKGAFTFRTNRGDSVVTSLYLDERGRAGFPVSSPQGIVHIDQASTTAAIPTLYLDQADLSEEFIEFASTVGAGNPIDTAAIGTYYGKIRVSVNGVGFKFIPLHNS